jgi:hypothetical protein
MSQRLRYSRDDLMASDTYAAPHEMAGYRLHGGFDASGAYVSPRVRHRWPAVRAWAEALQRRDWPLIDATTTLLKLPNYPTAEQQRLLLRNGFGQSFWNSLTVTGVIEARGKALATFTPPDMQKLIVEDIGDTGWTKAAAILVRPTWAPMTPCGSRRAIWSSVRTPIPFPTCPRASPVP